MSVARLWPLAFLVIEPLIILLYMIKQKAKDVQVPSTYLWREAYKSVQSDTPWEKLKHNIIMYLQLLAVLSLIIACLSPILKNGKSSADRVIVGLDTTASMLMEDENGKSRIDRAKEDLVTYAESLKKGTLVTVVAMGDTPSIIYEGRADGLLLKSALSGVKAEITDGSAYEGLDYLRSLLKEKGGDCYIYTDTIFDTGSSAISLVNVGGDADNYSVDYMQGIYTEGELTEYVGVTNHSADKVLQADLALYIEGELFEVRDISLEAGKSASYGFLLGDEGTEKKLRATLHVKDALNNDNDREDFVYEEGLGKICLVTERNTFLENAILAAGKYELVLAESPEMLPTGCEIYIFDGMVPESFPESPYIVFEKGETDTEVRLLSSDDVFAVSGVKTYELTENDTPLMVTKEGEACAFIRKEGKASKVYVGFDLHMGDFVLDAQFPIFLYNTLSGLQRSEAFVKDLYSFPASESGVMSGYSVGSVGENAGNVIKAGEKTARNITVYFIIAVIILLIAITIIYIVRKESTVIPVLRGIAVIFLALAALDISISYSAKGHSVIYLIDASESNLDNIKQAEKFVKEAIATKTPGDMQAVLVFGKDVKTENFLAKDSIFSEVMARPVSSATNLESAVDAGLKLISPGSAGKIVLLTDGAENEGSILKTVSEIRAKNAEVLVVLFDREETSENYISGVRIPADVEIGNEFTVSVTVESNVDTDGILTLYEESLGGSASIKAEKKVHLHAGSNDFVFTDVREKSGLIFYKAVLESGKDTESVNNSYSAYTKAEAGEKYLLVTNDTEDLFFILQV
ncbi:MAG: BatA domain-containing protein [Lachnospiraceae bacterium]|nr:BatA domain-containing protein [Lachnospiraceae bacterium]